MEKYGKIRKNMEKYGKIWKNDGDLTTRYEGPSR
jgi:hypothetical protein